MKAVRCAARQPKCCILICMMCLFLLYINCVHSLVFDALTVPTFKAYAGRVHALVANRLR